MLNMFGSGPSKMTLQELAHEVGKGVSRTLGRLWERKKGWQRSSFQSRRGAHC